MIFSTCVSKYCQYYNLLIIIYEGNRGEKINDLYSISRVYYDLLKELNEQGSNDNTVPQMPAHTQVRTTEERQHSTNQSLTFTKER